MNRKQGLIVGVLMLGLIILVVYLFTGKDTQEYTDPQFVSDKWDREFIFESKEPQGLALFRKLAEQKTAGSSVLLDSLPTSPDSASTYMFVGDKFGLHNREFDTILQSVRKNGCDLFLSYHKLMDNIWPHFFGHNGTSWYFDDEITIFTDQRTYRLFPVFQTDTIGVIWRLLDPDNIADTSFTTLSSVMEMPNFIRLKLGKGNIYLHSNPELFFNYQMLSRTGFRHAGFVVSHLRPQYKLKWLELGRISENFGNTDTDQMEGDGGREDTSMLKLIFSKKELLIALLLTILGILLYLIFRTRRYWPQVPYIPASKNRSLDFADTMTAIYLDQQSPYSILVVMRRNFRASISKHFFLDISKQDNTHEVKLLSEKIGVGPDELQQLVTMLENARMQAVTYEYVQEAARRQREFYIRTGIIRQKAIEKSEQRKIEFKRQIIVASALVFVGINAIIRGFYMLSLAQGWGILLWPSGLLMLLAGIYLFNRRLMTVEKGQLTWYPSFGRKKTFDLDDILEVKTDKGFTVIGFTGNRTLRINHFEISSYSRKHFAKFIARYVRLQ